MDAGRFVVAFGQEINSGQSRITFQIGDAQGNLIGSPVETEFLDYVSFAAAPRSPSGFAYYGLEAFKQGDAGLLRTYTADGALANTGGRTSLILERASMAPVSGGRFLVTGATTASWEPSRLYGLLLDPTGQQIGSPVTIGSSASIDSPSTASLQNGQVISVWVDQANNRVMGQLLGVPAT